MARKIILLGSTGTIGRKIAETLVEEGHSLAIIGRSDSRLRELVRSVGSSAERIKCIYTADLRDLESSKAAVASSSSCLGGLDVLINSAGVWDDTDPWKITLDKWLEIFVVNTIAPYMLSLEASKYMEKGGTIINMGCLTATRNHRIYKGLRPSPAYLSSKVAITYLTKQLAEILAPRGIRVITIAPSWVYKHGIGETLLKAIKDTVPLKRPADPGEIAEVIRAIINTKTPYITGSVIEISGGL
ncbi:MAG: SDR family oxidoreductase [Desulfurococcales archaeon]|nr:SDR family oxidoreductase [Desulfurococcales archaeon]